MYFLLILFFGSLAGITLMIGKKIILLRNGQLLSAHREEFFFKAPPIKKWRKVTIQHTKKHGYSLLVTTIRLYFRSSNFLKNRYADMQNKIKKMRNKKGAGQNENIKEASSFLKMISEYKHKIQRIKEQVKEEENL